MKASSSSLLFLLLGVFVTLQCASCEVLEDGTHFKVSRIVWRNITERSIEGELRRVEPRFAPTNPKKADCPATPVPGSECFTYYKDDTNGVSDTSRGRAQSDFVIPSICSVTKKPLSFFLSFFRAFYGSEMVHAKLL